MTQAVSSNEFARGWRLLLGGLIGVAAGVSSIYFYSLGIFIKPLAAEFGWTRGQASLGALVGTACAALVSPIVGRLLDRFGSTPVAIVSLLLLATGLAAHSYLIHDLTSFLVVTAAVSLLTAGSSPMPYTRLTVAGFTRHRGLALGVILGGTGLGAILIPRLLTPLVASEGWRTGYVALGLAAIAAIPLVLLLLRGAPDPAVVRAEPLSLRQILRTPGFYPLAGLFFLASVAVFGAVVQFVPLLTDAGLKPAEAGKIAGLIGLAAIIGRLICGFLLDRLSAALVTCVLFLLSAAGLLMLALGGVGLAAPAAIAAGVAVGAEVDLMAFLVARYFPARAFGQVNGLIYSLFLMGGALGPALFGLLYDRTGAYRVSLIAGAALLVCVALISLKLPPPAAPDTSSSEE